MGERNASSAAVASSGALEKAHACSACCRPASPHLEQLLHFGDAGGAAHQHHVVHILLVNPGVLEHPRLQWHTARCGAQSEGGESCWASWHGTCQANSRTASCAARCAAEAAS